MTKMTNKMLWLLTLILSSQALKLFVVMHSHCDTGWLDTIEGYYNSKVQHILRNILEALESDESFRMVWSETSFLKMWMERQPKDVQERMKRLVSSGRLEIAGGGFVQNDEASPNFESIIRQLETGHAYLHDTFGIKQVEVGWQLDPFGYSALTPSLLSKFGYKYHVINRIDSGFKVNYTQSSMKSERNLEFLWQSTDLGQTPDILTHVLYDHYAWPRQIKPGTPCFRSSTDQGSAWYHLFSAQSLYSYAN